MKTEGGPGSVYLSWVLPLGRLLWRKSGGFELPTLISSLSAGLRTFLGAISSRLVDRK